MKIDDLKPAPYNPREITSEAMSGLQASIEEFGDISGIVWNKKTGNLVAGHQRLEAIKKKWGEKLDIKKDCIITPVGKFPIRIVDWELPLEKAACIAANSQEISGTFTDDLQLVIEDVNVDLPDLSKSLLLEQIIEVKDIKEPELQDDAHDRTFKFTLSEQESDDIDAVFDKLRKDAPKGTTDTQIFYMKMTDNL